MKTFGIVIPGGAGFVGRNLVRVLNSENYDMNEITVLNKDEENLEYVKKYGVKTRCVDSVRKDDYAKTKLEGEELVKNSGLEYCILQPSIMYGSTDDEK